MEPDHRTSSAAGAWTAALIVVAITLLSAFTLVDPSNVSNVQAGGPGYVGPGDAGFSTGDEEQGRLALALPDCLRWDYRTPYEKVYLLCGSQVHSWNPGEPSGRRYPIDPAEAPGLDLLRMRVDALATRYAARSRVHPDGGIEIILDPLQQVSDIQRARFELEPDGRRLRALSYEDQEGSLTRFQFSDYHPLGEIELFSPPANLRWEED